MSNSINEQFDLFDSQNMPLNRCKSRFLVHKEGDWHRSVHIWIKTPDFKWILQKRSANKDTHPGLWDMASAGHLDSGEIPLNAAKRELQEETGIQAQDADLLYCFTRKNEYCEPSKNILDCEFQSIYLCLKKFEVEQLIPQLSEVEQFSCFSHNEVMQMQQNGTMVEHSDEYLELIKFLEQNRIIHKQSDHDADELSNNDQAD